ncbi:putative GTPase activating protein [Trypanosoma theileri]|uniref:Putative GTPase activating protein n=1 Tax=Trypanosoma theileri TaxID=67003 RepID=A0A1X0P423_9TRYP|nr:putative GTPase activating protein [Trypanosoma theileri]ORC91190.1 putative GTPase activating protein [Trypanosoma theileri]
MRPSLAQTIEGKYGAMNTEVSENGSSNNASHLKKGHNLNEGISIILLSTYNVPHGLRQYASNMRISTKFVEEYLANYRDVILLAREYGEKTETERTHLRLHLMKLRQNGGNTDANSSASSILEQQLSDLMHCENSDTQPFLLSESLRYDQILRDMRLLARGLLIPTDLLRYHHHWLLLQEDVRLTLAGRIHHCRVVARRSPPVISVRRLWSELWELLGAAWRQRRRLMGVEKPKGKEEECRDDKNSGRKEHESDEDDKESDAYAFGPLLPHRIGVTTARHYAIRSPLLAFLRSLRVQVWDTPTSKTRGNNGIYTTNTTTTTNTNTTRNSQTGFRAHSPSSPRKAAKGFLGNSSYHTEKQQQQYHHHQLIHNAPFFDITTEDVEACRVPYLSPQQFKHLRLHGEDVTGDWQGTFVAHTYSDDVWNIAVLTVEFMLTGFTLAKSCCAHPDHHTPPTSSLFEDIVEILVVYHKIPFEGAQNFIYATLHELSLLLLKSTVRSEEKEGQDMYEGMENSSSYQEEGPLPQKLAKEWYYYLRETYKSDADNALLREIAENGLRWSRQERWEAFQSAHALVLNEDKKNNYNNSNNNGNNNSNGGNNYAEDVLNTLISPLMPLHPMLFSSALKNDLDESLFSLDAYKLSSSSSSCFSLWEFQMQMQLWRLSVGRHAVIDGGCRKDAEAKQAVLFRNFIRLVRRALKLQKTENGEKGNISGHPYHDLDHTNTSLRLHDDETVQVMILHEFLRGLRERGALFSYCVNMLPPQGNNKNDNVLNVFPFSQVFLSMKDLLSLLHKDVMSLSASSPATSVTISVLDSIVGNKLHLQGTSPSFSPTRVQLPSMVTARRTIPTTTTPGAKVELLSIAKRVIRTMDLNIVDQLKLVTDLRNLLLVLPMTRRASLLCQYLQDAHIAGKAREVPIPATIRGEVWGALLQVPSSTARANAYYALNTALPSSADRQLSVDIPRCHQYHPLLASAAGHDRLRCIIKAWLLMNPGLTYWQGMDSVCAILLSVSFTNEPLVLALLQQLTELFIPHDAVSSISLRVRSMEDHLHQFAVLVRYCDPLLAFHLFDEVDCRPELFAISWFLTLLAHSLPVGKVCLLWDFLFVYSDIYPHCLTVLCLSVLLQHRDRLLGNDLSICILTLSRMQNIDVQLVLSDAVKLLRTIPPAVACLPYYSMMWSEKVRCRKVSHIDVQTIVEAFQMEGELKERHQKHMWMSLGLFLVDLRTERRSATALPQQLAPMEERVIGALLFPMMIPSTSDDHTDSTVLSQRFITNLATELLLQTRNMAMAALPPFSPSATSKTMYTGDETSESSAFLEKQVISPHIVLFTQGSGQRESAEAELLALELVRSGTPHVSILLGGFAELKREAPQLIVEVEEG